MGDLERRLRRLRRELIAQRVVTPTQANGAPWCFTVSQAAKVLGVSAARVERFLSVGLLRSLDLGEPMIPASQVARLSAQLRRLRG